MTQSNNCCGGAPGKCGAELAQLLSPKLFKALSDPTRLSLLVRLSQAESPRTVGELANGSEVDISVVSRHLATLREAGVLECRKHGKEVRCFVKCGEVAGILRELADALDNCCAAGVRSDSCEIRGQSPDGTVDAAPTS